VQCKQDTLEAYDLLKDYVEYVHIKDALWESRMVVPAGMGDGNVEAILGKLKAAGYTGFLSLEPHLKKFTGFAELEKHASEQELNLNREEAFTLAYDSLMKILERL